MCDDNEKEPTFSSLNSSILELVLSPDANRGFSLKSKTEWQTVDPDETAYYKPSHLGLHCTDICFGLRD